ncbi:MAG: hypothetical protein H0T42_26485 [Deltaproteobacteria bacterium]|nr:hypothetical protein [Deltaproteobacteria bacterium]
MRMHASHGPESRRLLEKLIREILRAETQAVEHPVREAKRLGTAPPVAALEEVARHATAMRVRFLEVLHSNDVPFHKGSLGATLATLRHLVVDRVVDAERSYRTALLDLRHGIDVVKLLREVSRRVELFGLIRWCDDWLAARRTLVACVEAQLAWFAQPEIMLPGALPIATEAPAVTSTDEADEDDCDVETSATETEKSSSPSRGWHTDRST